MVSNKIIQVCILAIMFMLSSYQNTSYSQDYNLVILSDIHLGSQTTMSLEPMGFNENNDLDLETFKKLLNNMNHLILLHEIDPNMILVLGDLIDHKSSNIKQGTLEGRTEQLYNSFYYIFQMFDKDSIPISYVFGNNDSLAGDYKEFYSVSLTKDHSPYEIARNAGWLEGFLSRDTSCRLNMMHFPCITEENQRYGYYVERLQPHLELIVINSVLFNNRTFCDESCNFEIEWLKSQLQIAHNNNDSVLLAMHLPPGIESYRLKEFWNSEAKNKFLSSVQPYSDNVIALLTAHTHMEEFQLIELKKESLIPIIYTAGLSTSHGNLPSFKYLTLHQDSTNGKWVIKNYKTYHFTRDGFRLFYSFYDRFCEIYKTDSISRCLHYLLKNDWTDVINSFSEWYTVGNPSFRLNIKTDNPDNYIIRDINN